MQNIPWSITSIEVWGRERESEERTNVEGGEMWSVDVIVGREEEEAVALDVDGGESESFVVGV